MAVLNPITDAAVLALDPSLEPEARLQSLLHLWLKRYFTLLRHEGQDGYEGQADPCCQKTFVPCEIIWQSDALPDPATKPVIHVVLPERATVRRDESPTGSGHDDDWTGTVFIRVPAILSGTTLPKTNPDHTARRVADQVAWLLSSSEREALTACGVVHLRLERPPAIVAATGPWRMRMLVFACRTRRENG